MGVQLRRTGAARSLVEGSDVEAARPNRAPPGQVPGERADGPPGGEQGGGSWLQRAWGSATDALGDALDLRQDEERLDAQEDLQAFMGRDYSAANFHPSTGRGLFDAHYAPAQGLLTITVRVHFDFRDGDPANPEWVANAPGNFPADAFRWTDDEKAGWQQSAIAQVRAQWSDRFAFHSTRPFWEALPTVNVETVITPTEDPADAHFDIAVHKWPAQGVVDGAHIVPPGGGDHSTGELNESADGQGITEPDSSHFVRGPGARAAYGDARAKNPGTIRFEQGSDRMVAGEIGRLDAYRDVLARPVMPPFPLAITGHAGSDEADPDALSTRRALAVNNALAGGVKTQPTVRGVGAAGADATEAWRRVDIHVGDFEANQRTVRHEFGHVFGLGDEYPAPDGGTHGASRPAGSEAAHSDLAERLIPGQQPIVTHHDASIMSNGEEMRPYHYVTFLEVLGQMTGTTGQWAIGPGGGLRMRQPGASDLPPIPGNLA